MTKKFVLSSILAAATLLALATAASAACPNQSPSITVPTSGEATVTIYDSATCSPLTGPFAIVVPGISLSSTTKPAFTTDATGILHFTANGAPFGTKLSATVTFSPDASKQMPLTIVVGGGVTGLVAGTISP